MSAFIERDNRTSAYTRSSGRHVTDSNKGTANY